MVLGGGAAVGGGGAAVGGLEVLALAEFGGLNPLPAGRVPEEVVGGGVDDLDAVGGFDVEVVEVGVVVDFVAGLGGGDGGGLAACEQDRGARGERLPMYQEDNSLVRTGNAPRVMASLRSLAVSLLRWEADFRNLARGPSARRQRRGQLTYTSTHSGDRHHPWTILL